jgi:hypothetical protein
LVNTFPLAFASASVRCYADQLIFFETNGERADRLSALKPIPSS